MTIVNLAGKRVEVKACRAHVEHLRDGFVVISCKRCELKLATDPTSPISETSER